MKKVYLKIIFSALVFVCGENVMAAQTKFSIQKHEGKSRASTFTYETIKSENPECPELEKAVNEYVLAQVAENRAYIEEEKIDFPYPAIELFCTVSEHKNYLAVNITCWFYLGASPFYRLKAFAYDRNKKKLVTLYEITGMKAEEIYREVSRQYKEHNDSGFDEEEYLKDNSYILKSLEDLAFTFMEDGRIYLLFERGSIFGSPECDFYLKAK